MNSLRIGELLGIVLLRFRMLPRIWAILLIVLNAGALCFITTSYGQVALAAVVGAVVVMVIIHARLGFVRLLGVGHVFWIPMLIYFAANLPDRADQPRLYDWVICLVVCNGISLVIDTVDVFRFVRGEREPHYRWKSANGK